VGQILKAIWTVFAGRREYILSIISRQTYDCHQCQIVMIYNSYALFCIIIHFSLRSLNTHQNVPMQQEFFENIIQLQQNIALNCQKVVYIQRNTHRRWEKIIYQSQVNYFIGSTTILFQNYPYTQYKMKFFILQTYAPAHKMFHKVTLLLIKQAIYPIQYANSTFIHNRVSFFCIYLSHKKCLVIENKYYQKVLLLIS
jgi:hypothetical protein